MSNPRADKHDLAGNVAAFMDKHGSEEAGKLLCRILLSIAEASNAAEIQYSDAVGEVHVRAISVDNKSLH